MLDAIQKGEGNSRYLKSVSDFLTKYPTYEAFVDALVAGTLPIDLGVNEDGWTQQGTPLDKANLLTDSTAALMGLADETATPNEMFAALANRITFGTQDLTAGESELPDGVIYFVYKE